MPVRCAWCGAQLGDDSRLAGESHGICAACEQINFPELPDASTLRERWHSGRELVAAGLRRRHGILVRLIRGRGLL